MSTPDSFVEEVTEAVRRDKLYAAFRKYGWIGGLVVIGIVGGDSLRLPGEAPVTIAELKSAHETWLPNFMAQAAE